MALTNVFVTVGTTKFDKLVNVITSDNLLQSLKKKQCKKLIIQVGKGIIPEVKFDGIDIDIFRLKGSIEDEVRNADLVISHAGAGTCLQVLQARKPLLVVVNELLMDNHQLELAEKFHEEGLIYFTTCSQIQDFFEQENLKLDNLVQFSQSNGNKFRKFIDGVMGFQ